MKHISICLILLMGLFVRRLNPPMQLFRAKEQKIIFLDNQNSIFLSVYC